MGIRSLNYLNRIGGWIINDLIAFNFKVTRFTNP